MSDPWFQTLFADRIGGANYGKGTEIYKFEKIKRAKRHGARRRIPSAQLLDFGIGENDDMADPLGARGRSSARSTSSRTAATPTTASQAFKEAAAGFMKQRVRRHARPGHGGQPRHRLQAGAGDAAGRASSTPATSRS